ncbi:vascular-related unknown protein 1-like [Silene latifolia]|uniref:vascular-related unknown protein 1-like n=1 Tax=Silene latifolia TaxID=37657 RepID=UPI003D76F164
MENSMEESGCETVGSREESGWTQYIDGFSEYNKQLQREGSSGYAISESMVSDAGSSPEWKQKLLNGLPKFPKRLNFKSKRTQEISGDDSLEDTASSPVHSPKITMNFKSMNLNSRQSSDDHDYHMVDGDISTDEHSKYNNYINRRQEAGINVEFTELRKKGLCLVPIAMVTNNLD